MNLIQRGTTASQANRGKSVLFSIAELASFLVRYEGTASVSNANSKIQNGLRFGWNADFRTQGAAAGDSRISAVVRNQ